MLKSLWGRLLAVAVILSVVPLVSGCSDPPLVRIAYRQIGGCQGVPDRETNGQPSGAVAAGAGFDYVAYRVDVIDNSAKGAATFNFDPELLSLGDSSHGENFVQIGYATGLGDQFGLPPAVFHPGDKTAYAEARVWAIVDRPDPNKPSSTTIDAFPLVYRTPAGSPGVNLVDEDVRPGFPYRPNCVDLESLG
ncbi:hypothetical protein Afil01_09780 [Actinorhabdospora filicis]|uniref:Uncharacterized protein n=1 Tax=Actinorhabdospora filicis TaxID=1785913 RepID=A0A9W6SIJ7_9ACTN|nr:hypothetical protein [Actinorhabdospora filicis]GLZ76171.1 hypothetical protein Afil01_09780 [Actinorhabdospora filicis]